MKTIRELRDERGWTQLELAIKLGVTPLTVHNWDRGKYEPSASKLRQIARVFEVSMDSIAIPGEDQEPKRAA